MRFLLLLTLSVLGLGITGCSTTYGGHDEFYNSHPEYDNRPGYYDPQSDDPANQDFFGVRHEDNN
jgi:hypothetical protein